MNHLNRVRVVRVFGRGQSKLTSPTHISNCYSITYWRDNSSPTELLWSPWKQLSVSPFVDIHWPVIYPFIVPQCVDYCGFINLEVSIVFQICSSLSRLFWLFQALWSSTYFRTILSFCTKKKKKKKREREKPAWVLIRIILNLQIISGSIDIFMNIESSN